MRFSVGSYIKDIMDEECISTDEFAAALGVSTPRLISILSGEARLTHRQADRLEAITGVSAETWLNIDGRYYG